MSDHNSDASSEPKGQGEGRTVGERRKCAFEGCGRPFRTRGWCAAHYNQVWSGNPLRPLGVQTPPNTPADFWNRVGVGEKDECWEWQGHKSTGGYGGIRFKGKIWRTHRLAYYLHTGHLPELDVLHSCDNPPCCNPNHLREGTDQDNAADKVARRRHKFGESQRCAKLTNDQVRSIKRALRDGVATQKQLCQMYGVSDSVMSLINAGKIWKLIEI